MLEGLNVRFMLAKVRILRNIDPDEADDLLCDCYQIASQLGFNYSMVGNIDTPLLITDDKFLNAAFDAGFVEATHIKEINDCQLCSTGENCIHHHFF